MGEIGGRASAKWNQPERNEEGEQAEEFADRSGLHPRIGIQQEQTKAQLAQHHLLRNRSGGLFPVLLELVDRPDEPANKLRPADALPAPAMLDVHLLVR